MRYIQINTRTHTRKKLSSLKLPFSQTKGGLNPQVSVCVTCYWAGRRTIRVTTLAEVQTKSCPKLVLCLPGHYYFVGKEVFWAPAYVAWRANKAAAVKVIRLVEQGFGNEAVFCVYFRIHSFQDECLSSIGGPHFCSCFGQEFSFFLRTL